MVQGTRRWPVRWGSAPRVGAVLGMVVTVIGAVLLTACSGPGGGTGSGPIRIRRVPSLAADADPSAPSPQSPVVSAWIAAQLAFENAVRTVDATAPELAATTVSPQLTWVQSFVTLVRVAGEVATGPVDLGVPHVVTDGTDLATVQACVHDREVVVSLANGRPVPGVLGQVDFELFTSTMERTPSGWKLANQVVGVGQCSGT